GRQEDRHARATRDRAPAGPSDLPRPEGEGATEVAARRGDARAPRDLMPLLVLFDVDGTLFLTNDALAGQALRETLEARFGVHLPEDAVERVPHPGQTSLKIARFVLNDAGLDDQTIGAGLTDWCPEFAAHYLELLRDAEAIRWEAA